MNVLITGAFGNAGQFVVKKFLEEGWTVIAFDLKTKKNEKTEKKLQKEARKLPGRLVVNWGDLTRVETLEPVFELYRINGVVHLAFLIPPFSELNPELSRKVNVGGTKLIIQLMKKHVPTAPLVFGSSVAVFGPVKPTDPPLNVNMPTRPMNVYSSQKIECENLVKSSGLDWRILRFSAIMNPAFRPGGVQMKYALRVPPTTRFEPVHVLDLATAVYNALVKKEASRKIFLIAGGPKNRMIYKEYLERSLRAHFGKLNSKDIPWENFTDKLYYLHWYDTKESQEILQFQQRTFDDYINDIKAMLPWWQKIIHPFNKKLLIKKLLSNGGITKEFLKHENSA